MLRHLRVNIWKSQSHWCCGNTNKSVLMVDSASKCAGAVILQQGGNHRRPHQNPQIQEKTKRNETDGNKKMSCQWKQLTVSRPEVQIDKQGGDLPRIWCWTRRWNTWCSSSLREPWNAFLSSSGWILVFNASWEGNTFMVLLSLTDMLVEAPFFFIFPRLARRCQWWERLIINIIPVSATVEPLGSVRFFSQQRQQIIPDIELQTFTRRKNKSTEVEKRLYPRLL